MQNLLIAISLISLMTSSCAPKKYSSQIQSVEEQQEIIHQKVEPTLQKYDKLTNDLALKYEAPERKIKNKHNNEELHIGLVKLSDTKSTYNSQTREMKVSGVVEILSDDKTQILGQKVFLISGKHSPKKGIFPLKPAITNQTPDETDIQVRARVTCLDFDKNDNFLCTKSIIDLFIKKDKKIYTEQLETKNETMSQSPTVLNLNDDKTEKNDDLESDQSTSDTTKETHPSTLTDENGLQAEGQSHEIKGRYVGTAATTQLDELFDDALAYLKKKKKKSNQNHESENNNESDTSANEQNDDAEDDSNDFNENFKVDQTGRVIKKNQAFGDYDAGKLRNASSLKEQMNTLKLQNLYEISFPERSTFYGTQEMMDIIETIGKKMNENQDKLYVANISKIQGGRLPPSVSHQIGMDVDLGYPTPNGRVKFPVVVDRRNKIFNTNAYSTRKTFELFKFLVTQKTTPIARIFTDQHIINDLCAYAKKNNEFTGPDASVARQVFNILSHVDGHGDHFHLRLMCTDNQPACNKIIYPKSNNCR